MTDNDFQKAIELIKGSKRILLTTHARPDGDACGSIAALCEAIVSLGNEPTPLMLSDIPDWYEFLFDTPPAILDKDVTTDDLLARAFDLVIIVDTNSRNQLPGFDKFLKANQSPVLVIDHHVTSDGLGDHEIIDTSAAAAGIIVFDLFRFARWPVTETVARALFTSVATDTGFFQFDNTDARTFRTAAELIDAGANPASMHRQLYQNFSPQRFALMTRMLDSLELHLDGRYGQMQITQADFKQTGSTGKDTESLIDEARRISTLQAVTLFVELPDAAIKCSLRSTGPVDVRKIAQKFQGGGHKMASGCRFECSMADAQKKVFELIEQQLEQIDAK